MTTAKPARQISKQIWVLSALVVAFGIGGGIYWRMRAQSVPMVGVETVTLGPVTRLLAVNGKIAAQDSVQIKSTVSGVILDLAVAEGDHVIKGTVLAQIDDGQQQTILNQARAALDHGQTLQAQAQATYDRYLELGPVMSRTTLDDQQRIALGAAQEVARLTALWDQARIQLSRYVVTAPISGTIILRTVQLGQLTDPALALFTLADLSILTVETTVDEAYATQIALGQTATMQLVGSRDILTGRVTFVSPRIDAVTGGRAVTIGFDTAVIAPVGMTVTANVVVDQSDALTIPRAAMQGDAVFVLQGETAHLTPITAIDWPAARLIVTSGVVVGDLVITDSTGISDGLTVAQE